jgi:nucleotide-binding universal stress UspA family protein
MRRTGMIPAPSPVTSRPGMKRMRTLIRIERRAFLREFYPPYPRRQMHKHILIPTDGSPTAQRGVDYGLALARDLGAKVTVLTITDPYSRSGKAVGAPRRPLEEEMHEFSRNQQVEADKILKKVKADAARLGVDTALVHVSEARPAEAILQVAEARGAHLIVIGSHGRRGVNRLLLGSQTAEVLAQTALPVLVVK